jgi:hypothetical protein
MTAEQILAQDEGNRITLAVPADEVRLNLGPAACPGINQTNAGGR